MISVLHLFHPKRHILHIKDAVIIPADPAHSYPTNVRLFARISINGRVTIRSWADPHYEGDDHYWKLEAYLADIVFPIGTTLIVVTILRQEESQLDLGSAYLYPHDLKEQDGQTLTLDLLSKDSDFPALKLRFSVQLGGTMSKNDQDPYAELDDGEFMMCLFQIRGIEILPKLTNPEVLYPLQTRAGRLSKAETKSEAFSYLGDIRLGRFQAHRFQSDRDAARKKYEQSLLILGNSNDLSDVESYVRQLADTNYTKQMRLWVLSNVLHRHRYRECGDSEALERAAVLGEQALQITPGDPITVERYVLLSTRISILCDRLERTSNLCYLDQSITLLSEAIEIAPTARRRDCLALLADRRGLRARLLFTLGDLERAIDGYDEIVTTTENDDPSLPIYLNRLGVALLDQYRLRGDIADLERSINVREKMLLLSPDEDPNRPWHIDTFCWALLERFKALGNKKDLDRCIELQKTVLAETPNAFYDGSGGYNVLGEAYVSQYEIDQDLFHLDQAIEIFQKRCALSGPQDVTRGHPEISLAEALHLRFRHTKKVSDLYRALKLYEAATSLLHFPYHQLFAAGQWAIAAIELADVDAQESQTLQLKASTVAMDLLLQLSRLGVPIETRRNLLKRVSRLTQLCVTVALLAKEYKLALVWVEQGRSVMWTQLMQLRVPVDDLRLVNPSLAQKLFDLGRQISSGNTEAGAGALLAAGDVAKSGISVLEDSGTRHRQLVSEWMDTVEEIRRIPEFSRFLRPKTAEELHIAAQSGPIVIIHVAEAHSQAIILIPELSGLNSGLFGQVVLSLGKFSSRDADRLLGLLVQATATDVAYRASSSSRAALFVPFEEAKPYEIFESILSELWYKVVSPILRAMSYDLPREGAVQSRIHWCPTGRLALLPLHAAGDYSRAEPGFKVFDYVVSSYTPNISALMPPSKNQVPLNDDVTLLAVAVSSPAGQLPIPGTREEIDTVKNRFCGSQTEEHFAVLTQSAATPDRVLAGMKRANWVHFACHGVQNLASPTDSALLLSGTSQLKLSHIVETSLPSAELAFLSACQTAAGDQDLPQESVHLAAGMLLAGYKGVIATMWSIMDRDAPAVSDDVYRYLLRDSTRRPDYREAAYALHHAVARLREKRGTRSYLSWVPFVHFGL